MKTLTIITPVFCESENIDRLFMRFMNVSAELAPMGIRTEFLFIDDASLDDTFDKLAQLARLHSSVKIVRFVRNFGSQTSLRVGLTHCFTDAGVIISADMQEPPELIVELAKEWQRGTPLVIATREKFVGSFFQKSTSRLFYRVINSVGKVQFPKNGSDVLLLDRTILNDFRHLKEKNPSIVGLVMWLGYPFKTLTYKREERKAGHSNWRLGRRYEYFIDILTAYSYFPMRAFSLCGLTLTSLAFAYGIFLLVRRLYIGEFGVPGWTALMVAVVFLNGFLILGVGLLGEYLWRVLDEVRNRPSFLIRETVNMSGGNEPSLAYSSESLGRATASHRSEGDSVPPNVD